MNYEAYTTGDGLMMASQLLLGYHVPNIGVFI
jgi:hypothetical protein